MRVRPGAVVLAWMAVLAAGPVAASSAAATGQTWTVRPGGAITAAAGTTTLTDPTTGAAVTCASSRMSGTFKAGSGLPGTGIGSITAAAYYYCATAGFAPRLTPRGLPWHLNLISYNRQTGVTRGTIGHLQLAVSIPEFFCSAAINGTSGTASDGMVAVTYADSTGKLTILPAGSNLHWYHVHNCAGVVRNGDPAVLSTAYAISPPQTITSP